VKLHIFKASVIYCHIHIIYDLLEDLLNNLPLLLHPGTSGMKELRTLMKLWVLVLLQLQKSQTNNVPFFVTRAVLRTVQKSQRSSTSSSRVKH